MAHPIQEDPEAELIPYVGPPKLLPVPIITGEENEDCVAIYHAKLYRYHNEEWKQRCQGTLKFLQHKQSKSIRMIMRQDATFFIRLNFVVKQEDDLCILEKSNIKENGFEWKCIDQGQLEQYCLKLNEEDVNGFSDQFQLGIQSNIFEE